MAVFPRHGGGDLAIAVLVRKNRSFAWLVQMHMTDKKSNLAVTTVLVGVLLTPFLLCGAWSYVWMNAWRDRTVRDVLPSVSDWPYSVQELHGTLGRVDPDLQMDGFLMYGAPGPYAVKEAAFRIHNATSTVFDVLKSQLQLVEIERDHSMTGWGIAVLEKATPEWWVNTNDRVKYFACQNLIDGEEGDLYVVAQPTESNTIYISYHYNF